jgi:hypothetical protein
MQGTWLREGAGVNSEDLDVDKPMGGHDLMLATARKSKIDFYRRDANVAEVDSLKDGLTLRPFAISAPLWLAL